MAKKNITINDLAMMVNKGFEATGKDIGVLKKEMHEGFKAVNERLDKLENKRMEKLEERMKIIEDALAIK